MQGELARAIRAKSSRLKHGYGYVCDSNLVFLVDFDRKPAALTPSARGIVPEPVKGPRLAIVCDFAEEEWASMDLVADSLYSSIVEQVPERFAAERVRPAMRRRFGGLSGAVGSRRAFNLDRLIGRFVDYPAFLRETADCYDMFHIADHTYAHLVHGLPAGRCGVYCHDLDAFRCLIEPKRDPRPIWFRKLATRILGGLCQASVVFYSTVAVRNEIVRHGLVPAERLVHAPYGVAAEFTPGPAATRGDRPYVLHVGSCISRKRVDVLLDVVARVRRDGLDIALVHVGGPFAPKQELQIDALGLRTVTSSMLKLTREQMAELYRGAALVLLPSESEGFGLPVIEALACGARVVASDIPVLREVGGDAVTYCRVGDVEDWAGRIRALLQSPESGPVLEARTAQAALFTWREHARIIVDAYTDRFQKAARDLESRRGHRR